MTILSNFFGGGDVGNQGCVTEPDCERESRIEEIKNLADDLSNNGEVHETGSWAWKEVHLGGEGDYQVIEAWAINDKREPMPRHAHEEEWEYIIVMNGSIVINGETIEAGGFRPVPPRTEHTTIPSGDAQVLIVCVPAVRAITYG